MYSLICVWINGWVNNGEAGDLRRYRARYDVTVMRTVNCSRCLSRYLLPSAYTLLILFQVPYQYFLRLVLSLRFPRAFPITYFLLLTHCLCCSMCFTHLYFKAFIFCLFCFRCLPHPLVPGSHHLFALFQMLSSSILSGVHILFMLFNVFPSTPTSWCSSFALFQVLSIFPSTSWCSSQYFVYAVLGAFLIPCFLCLSLVYAVSDAFLVLILCVCYSSHFPHTLLISAHFLFTLFQVPSSSPTSWYSSWRASRSTSSRSPSGNTRLPRLPLYGDSVPCLRVSKFFF